MDLIENLLGWLAGGAVFGLISSVALHMIIGLLPGENPRASDEYIRRVMHAGVCLGCASYVYFSLIWSRGNFLQWMSR